MALTKQDIHHIADLARLALTPEEEERFLTQLSSILEYVSQLQEVDTDATEYQYQVEGLKNVTAKDEVIVCDEDVRKRILQAMPDRIGDLLKVKGVFHD